MAYLDTSRNPDFFQIDFLVTESTPTHKVLTWIPRIQPDTEEVLPDIKGYNLYYNIIPTKFKKINKDLIKDTFFHHIVASYNKRDRGYYIVEAVYEDNKKKSSGVYDIYIPFDAYAKKASRETLYHVLNQRSNLAHNIPAFLYAQKPHGTPNCPMCNKLNQGAMKSKCPTCLGTGKEGGFEGPLLIFMQYSNNFSHSIVDQGNRKANEINQQVELPVEMGLIQIGDMIREGKTPFRVFTVDNISISEYNGRPMKMFLNLMVEESAHMLWTVTTPKYEIAPHIDYFNCREAYYNAVCSVDPYSTALKPTGFPASVLTETQKSSGGLVSYKYYQFLDNNTN